MNAEESLQAAIHENIELRDYDPAWPSAFSAERQRLESLLPTVFVGIEHIGSTAVPGLVAKPVIDILAGVKSLCDPPSLIARVCESGYTTSIEFNRTLIDRLWFMRWSNGHRTHHLHVVIHGSPSWCEHVRFRDALRKNKFLAARYTVLKMQLSEKYRSDREAYTDDKTGFVQAALRDA